MRRVREAPDAGFTLLELTVAMSIASILFGLAGVTMVRGFAVTARAQDHIFTVTDTQYALDALSRNVRVADPLSAGSAQSLTAQVRRAGQCRAITYAFVTTAAAPPAGYRSTGRALTSSELPCSGVGTPTVRVLIPAVPVGSGSFTYYARGSTAPLTAPLSATDLPRAARIAVSVASAARGTTRSSVIATDIYVRNAP